MDWKAGIFAAVLAIAAAGPAWAGCSAGDRIDGSTAEQARHKIVSAGYQHVNDLRKGCDNYWHGRAMKDGTPVWVVLSPQGEVMIEGN